MYLKSKLFISLLSTVLGIILLISMGLLVKFKPWEHTIENVPPINYENINNQEKENVDAKSNSEIKNQEKLLFKKINKQIDDEIKDDIKYPNDQDMPCDQFEQKRRDEALRKSIAFSQQYENNK